jgi:hypothetical protein
MRPDLEKNPSQKRAGGVAQKVGPKFKPQYRKKKKIKPQEKLNITYGYGMSIAALVIMAKR